MFWQRGHAWLICTTNTQLSTLQKIYCAAEEPLCFSAGRKAFSEEQFNPPPSTTTTPTFSSATATLPTASISNGRQNKQHCPCFILGSLSFSCLRFGDGWVRSAFWHGWWGSWRQSTVFTRTTSSSYCSVTIDRQRLLSKGRHFQHDVHADPGLTKSRLGCKNKQNLLPGSNVTQSHFIGLQNKNAKLWQWNSFIVSFKGWTNSVHFVLKHTWPISVDALKFSGHQTLRHFLTLSYCSCVFLFIFYHRRQSSTWVLVKHSLCLHCVVQLPSV